MRDAQGEKEIGKVVFALIIGAQTVGVAYGQEGDGDKRLKQDMLFFPAPLKEMMISNKDKDEYEQGG